MVPSVAGARSTTWHTAAVLVTGAGERANNDPGGIVGLVEEGPHVAGVVLVVEVSLDVDLVHAQPSACPHARLAGLHIVVARPQRRQQSPGSALLESNIAYMQYLGGEGRVDRRVRLVAHPARNQGEQRGRTRHHTTEVRRRRTGPAPQSRECTLSQEGDSPTEMGASAAQARDLAGLTRFDAGVAIRLIVWFPPGQDTVVVTVFAGDKKRIGDAFYSSAAARADAAIDRWLRQQKHEQRDEGEDNGSEDREDPEGFR